MHRISKRCGLKLDNHRDHYRQLSMQKQYHQFDIHHRPPSRPENMTVQNPYASPNPYSTPLQAPPPPRSLRQIWRRIFIVLGSVIGFAITSFGVMGLFITLQSIAGFSDSINSAIPGFIAAIVIICVGTLILCKSATYLIGRWIAGFSVVVAAIAFLYSIFTSSTPSNFIGGTVILLLAGLLFRTTRKRRW